jgi:hypothetical protein
VNVLLHAILRGYFWQTSPFCLELKPQAMVATTKLVVFIIPIGPPNSTKRQLVNGFAYIITKHL